MNSNNASATASNIAGSNRKVLLDDNHREIEAEFSRLKALDAKGSKADMREFVITTLCCNWGMFADEVSEIVDEYLKMPLSAEIRPAFFCNNDDGRQQARALCERLAADHKKPFYVTATSEVPMERAVAVCDCLVFPSNIFEAKPLSH